MLAMSMLFSNVVTSFADPTDTESSDDEEEEEEDEDSNTASSSGGTTRNTSSDIIATYINLAAGKSNFGASAELSFTKDQLRFLGVYISNFFVPFGTEFGEAKNSDTDKTMQEIKDTLQNTLNFSNTYAEMFSETLIGLARNSVKDLVFAGECSDGEIVIPSTYKIDNNYFNFMMSMFGNSDKLINSLQGGKLKEYLASGGDKQLVKCYWGYQDGSNFIPMFDCYPTPGKVTPSQVAFNKCLASVNTDMGYGFNIYDVTTGEEKEKFESSSISDDILLNMSILGNDIKVDCFGDILVCGKQHQFVAVPGAMNPYTWVVVDSAGKDILDPGESYNLINVPSMSIATAGTFMTSSSISDINTIDPTDGEAGTEDGNENQLKNYTLVKDNGKRDPTVFFLTNDLRDKEPANVTKFKKAITYVLSYIDSVPDNYGEYTVSMGKSKITISAKTKTLSTLDYSKLDGNFSYKDKAKYKKFMSSLETITKGINVELHPGESQNCRIKKDVLKNAIKKVKKSAKEDLVEGGTEQGTDPSTGNTNARSKVFGSSLSRSFPEYLRTVRGENEYNIDGGFFGGGKSTERIDTIKEKFASANEGDTTYNLFEYSSSPGADGVYAPVLTAQDSSNYLSDCILFIDNLGDFNFDSSSGLIEDYKAFPAVNYVSENSTTIDAEASEAYQVDPDTFTAGFTDIVDGKLGSFTVSDPLAASLYITYCVASLYDTAGDLDQTIGKLGYRMNVENMIEIPNEPLDISGSIQSDLILTSIRDWLYYLLHPTEGLAYFRILITNKINSFLIGWHNDMLGTHGVGQTLGTTRYRNTTGYVTTPDLSEIEWTNALINFYNDCIPFLLIVMIITMVLAYVTGILPIQRSIFGVAIFAMFLLMPVNLINGVVGISNRVSERIYGEKFTYWALMQMESYASAIDDAASGGGSSSTSSEEDEEEDTTTTTSSSEYVNYLTTLYKKNSEVYTNQGNESIVLKWQAPKKMTSLMYQSDETYDNVSDEGQQMLDMFLGTTMTGETFIDDPESVYLYRSYVDISNYSRYVYRGIQTEPTQPSKRDLTNNIMSNWDSGLKSAAKSMNTNYQNDRKYGYTNANSTGDTVGSGIKITVPFTSAIINDALGKRGKVADLSIKNYVGISPLMFNLGIPAFNKKLDLKEELLSAAGSGDAKTNFKKELNKYSEEDLVGLMAYSLYSENVFFYFSWDLYDLGLIPSSDTNSGYKDLLLGEDGAGFFYNKSGNGELKDFMDMKSLFTYVIPYLKQCNDLVREWDDIYGVFMYDGVPYEDGHWEDEAIKGNKEMKQKYWHNINVNRLYSMYTPWVDVMYECSYADGEYIHALGQKYFVENPLDPSSYPTNRPMIFSESEMHDYGLGRGDLTKVERLILDCNRGMEERMYELLNYFNFSDVTLNTAAAMNCAFEFNTTFSENGMFSNNRNIYPQAFELSDFSYDAFLRFILSNTTGEAMNAEGDFYGNIVNNSSMTTILVMLGLDILSMYILPAFKIFFLIAVFLSAVLIIICTAFRVDPDQRFIKKVLGGVVIPMVKFLATTICFSYAISLFMGVGNNAVTQSKELSINMGSPVTVMICMIALNLLVMYVYFKIIKVVLNSIKRNAKLAVNFMGGVAGSAISMAGSVLAGKAFKRATAGSTSSGGDVSVNGTGNKSPRAEMRSVNKDTTKYEEPEYQSSRQNDTKRSTIRTEDDTTNKRESNRRKEELNKKTNEGVKKFNFGREKNSSARNRRLNSGSKDVKDLGNNKHGRV